MSPATAPRNDPGATRLLVLAAEGPDDRDGSETSRNATFAETRVDALPDVLRPGDLVVVNDAATLPASFDVAIDERGTRRGTSFELRLTAFPAGDSVRAIAFGRGDFRTETERRGPPPHLVVGDEVMFVPGVTLVVTEVDASSPRRLGFRCPAGHDAFVAALFAHGRPVQYAYVARPLALWDVQTRYAGRPWAVEAPSAGLPLTTTVLSALRNRGVAVARLTHGAGLSSTGDTSLDRRLPFPETYEIPPETVRAVEGAHARGGRVVAIGTSVVRALEGNVADHGTLRAGTWTTDLRIGPSHALRVVDALLTGMHERGVSHFDLLQAFVRAPRLDRAHAFAESRGFFAHEFGDTMLAFASPDVRGRQPFTTARASR
ncbi:MAG: S-adenosylmethionine:tRNA ribosyltransferase-isomerase [Polyangiaceae bacterium]